MLKKIIITSKEIEKTADQIVQGEHSVSIPSFYFRNMLLQYDRQLVTARRLARLKAELRDQTPVPTSAETKRRAMVEHVARELLDNLLFTGSDNPVVREVRQELNRTLHGEYSFRYPPGEVDVRIFREEPEGSRELTSEERKNILAALWEITLAKVDATML